MAGYFYAITINKVITPKEVILFFSKE